MKTINFSTIIALCSVVIYGCSTKSAAPPQLVAVPEQATVVLSLNAKQIIDKAELNRPDQYQSYSLLQRELDNDPSESTEALKNFLKDTRTSGLNLDHIVAYVVAGDDNTKGGAPGFGIVFLIDDVKTFEAFLKNIDLDPDDIANRSFEFFYAKMQWNDRIAVLSKGVTDYGIDIFNDDKSQSVLANESFRSEYSKSDDAYLFVDYGNFFTVFADMFGYAGSLAYVPDMSTLAELYKDLSLAVKFNAEKGEFVATGKLLPAGKVAKLFEKFYSTDFDDNLYNYFTDESLMAFKLAIKPLDVYDEYKKYAGSMAGYDQNIAALVKRYDPKITSILGHFTGDLLASLSSVSIGDIPDFTVAAGILEGKAGEVAALVEGLGFTKTPEGYYALGRSFYFAVNDKAACLTGTLAHVKNFLNGGSYKPNITAAAGFGAALKNAPVYFYWDVNINKYPAILKSGIAMTPVGNSILPLLERLDAITVRTVDTNGSEFKVKFTNKNDYASKTFLQSFDEWAFQYFRQYME